VDYLPCDLTRDEDCTRAVAGQNHVLRCTACGAAAGGFIRSHGTEFLESFFRDARLLATAHAGDAQKFLWFGSTTAYPPTGDRPTVEEDLFLGEPFEKCYAVGWCKRFTEMLCSCIPNNPAKNAVRLCVASERHLRTGRCF
jgi:GDP-L-fucose synthase